MYVTLSNAYTVHDCQNMAKSQIGMKVRVAANGTILTSGEDNAM